MRKRSGVLTFMVAVSLPLAILAATATTGSKTPKSLSVGDFAVMLASASGGARDLDAARAADSLVRSGVRLGDLNATLTDGRLAEILRTYGLKVTSTSPDSAVSREKAQAALLLVNGAPGPGRSMAPASRVPPGTQTLDDCLAQPNHGQCENCCKDFGSSGSQCARFCQQINKPSDSEPLP
jgi:hypothetical protein